ncbi:MAG: porin [Candidatus Manganitrophaceae bacterium]
MSRYRFMRSLVLSGSITLLASLPIFHPSGAHAGATIKIDEVRSLNIGMGLRSSFNMEEDAAPSEKDRSKEFAVDNFRFYLSGQLHEGITFEFNTDYNNRTSNTPNESVRLLDGVIKFGFNDYINLWVGRFLPPSDRSNLSGPYYLNAWDFPFVQMYPNVFSGRDDGASLWGQVGGGKFKYQVGTFNGRGVGRIKKTISSTPAG